MTDGLRLTREVAKKYGRRGGLVRAAANRWYIEGEQLTVADVSKRLGISLNAAQKRIRRIRKKGQPLTWSAIKLEKQ